MSGPRHAADRRRDRDQQCNFEHGLSGQLLDTADLVSDDLLAILSAAVIAVR
jgi:hypothetical protein